MSEEPKTTVSDYIKALFTMADNMEQPCEQDERQRVLVAANKLKAAWERERVEIAARAATDAVNLTNKKWMRDCANVAKLREALKTMVCLFEYAQKAGALRWLIDEYKACRVLDLAQAALAVPPRNCDVWTAKEQDERYRSYCSSMGCGN